MTDQLYKDISQETFDRIIQIDKVDEFDLKQVGCGILSIHARWSLQSVMHGKSILSLIDNSKFKDFEINIINIGSISVQKQIELIGAICHGYFESVWIEKGKVEFRYRDNNRSTELAQFKDYLNEKIKKTSNNVFRTNS